MPSNPTRKTSSVPVPQRAYASVGSCSHCRQVVPSKCSNAWLPSVPSPQIKMSEGLDPQTNRSVGSGSTSVPECAGNPSGPSSSRIVEGWYRSFPRHRPGHRRTPTHPAGSRWSASASPPNARRRSAWPARLLSQRRYRHSRFPRSRVAGPAKGSPALPNRLRHTHQSTPIRPVFCGVCRVVDRLPDVRELNAARVRDARPGISIEVIGGTVGAHSPDIRG